MAQTATLIAAIRNEGPFILEWVAYHRAIGFDQIVLFADASGNGNADGSTALLQALDTAGIIIHVPNGPETGPAKGHRHRAYARALSHPAVQAADWAMALDLDEYLTIHTGNGHLSDLLDVVDDVDVVSPAWRIFGNNGIIEFQDAPLMERFTRAAPAAAILTDRHLGLKSLFQPRSVTRIGPHRPLLDTQIDAIWVNGSGQNVTHHLRDKGWAANARTLGYELCQINHYMTRSNEVFALLNLTEPPLGDDAAPLSLKDYKTFNTNHIEDTSLARCVAPVAKGIAALRALPDVAAAHDACVQRYHALIATMREDAAKGSDIAALLDQNAAQAVINDQVKWLATYTARTQAAQAPAATPAPAAIDPDDAAPRWLADLRRSDFRKGWYHSDAKFAAQFTQRSADTLVVSFDNLSNVNEPALARETWGYGFYRSEGWSHLGVMAFEKNWYRDEALFDFMETQGAALFAQFKTVVLTGTSMGAYAATAFSKLAPGCTVVAFSPQATLDKKLVPWEERFGSGRKQDWSGRYRDAPDHCGPAGDVFVVYDPYFAPDKMHAERYYGDNVTFLKSWYSGHKSALFIRRADILKAVMQQAVAGTLSAAGYYQMIRSRRDLIWYYNGLATHLIEAGHLKLADQLAKHLLTLGKPNVARAIQARL
jgi:hypothetical protein